MVGGKFKIYALIVALVILVFSCSSSIKSPKQFVSKMYRAYGGEKGVALLNSFEAYGFIKDPGSGIVARSDPYDIFYSGGKFKVRRYRVVKGKAKDVIVYFYNGREGYEYRYSKGGKEVPEWEIHMVKYRFPSIISWSKENLDKAKEVIDEPESGLCYMSFENGDDLVRVAIERDSGRVREIEVRSKSDTSFSIVEKYSDYTEFTEVPFPCRFTSFYRGNKYYEYFLPTVKLGVSIPDSIFGLLPDDTSMIYHGPKEKKQEM